MRKEAPPFKNHDYISDLVTLTPILVIISKFLSKLISEKKIESSVKGRIQVLSFCSFRISHRSKIQPEKAKANDVKNIKKQLEHPKQPC